MAMHRLTKETQRRLRSRGRHWKPSPWKARLLNWVPVVAGFALTAGLSFMTVHTASTPTIKEQAQVAGPFDGPIVVGPVSAGSGVPQVPTPDPDPVSEAQRVFGNACAEPLIEAENWWRTPETSAQGRVAWLKSYTQDVYGGVCPAREHFLNVGWY